MLHLIIFLITYFAGLVLYFQLLQRPLFLFYNRSETDSRVSPADIFRMARHGFRSDIIVASYLSAPPLIAAVAQTFIHPQFLGGFMTAYNIAAGIILGLSTIVDAALYPFWKFKLDASILPYLRSIKGACASVSTLYIIPAVITVLVMAAVSSAWLQGTVILSERLSGSSTPFIADGLGQSMLSVLIFLLSAGALFAMIRGLGRRPNNPSVSFYSNILFFNHCALNPLYSFIYSLSVNDKIEGAFRAFDDETCHREFAHLFPGDTFPTDKLLNTDRTNVLFIIWESLSARFVGELGGQPGVTPNIDRLAREGILFTRVDCNSFRTDRGLVALLSGYLAQPTTSVIRMTKKVPNLPALPRRFKEAGYDTMAVHGGDLTIFHKGEYYLTVGHDRVVGDKDLPKGLPSGKWGIHDGAVLDWIYDDIMDKTSKGRRWYTTFQTLSSHEPWIVPYTRLKDDEIANTFAYVDDAIGRFVDRLKKTPAWDSLLIVITGDHGCNTGQHLPADRYAHIPLLMTGGAVKAPRRIDTIMSQTDTAATLLGQLGISHDEFIFSRDVMAESYTYPFGFHTFVNGFMFRDATGYTVYDNVSDTATDSPDPDRERKGRIILQYLYEDLARR